MKLFDITGQRFGSLVAIEIIKRNDNSLWRCKCDCGKEIFSKGIYLRAGRTYSCGCQYHKVKGPNEDLTGQKFGRLTVLKIDHREKTISGGRYFYLCKCDCGNERVYLSTNLKKGLATTCGCGRMMDYEPGEVGLNELYNSYKSQASKRHYIYDIDKETFKQLTSSNCVYCGSEPNQILKAVSDRSAYTYNGLDRVDNTKGYTKENVVPCCGWCNTLKHNKTQEEFKEQIRKIHKHLGL